MPAWFETARQIVELAVVVLLAAQAAGRWLERRESNEERAGESLATLRRDLDEVRGSLDRRVHVNELAAVNKAIERIDAEIIRQRDHFHELRTDVQTELLRLANMRQGLGT
jgi:hypothetical protein